MPYPDEEISIYFDDRGSADDDDPEVLSFEVLQEGLSPAEIRVLESLLAEDEGGKNTISRDALGGLLADVLWSRPVDEFAWILEQASFLAPCGDVSAFVIWGSNIKEFLQFLDGPLELQAVKMLSVQPVQESSLEPSSPAVEIADKTADNSKKGRRKFVITDPSVAKVLNYLKSIRVKWGMIREKTREFLAMNGLNRTDKKKLEREVERITKTIRRYGQLPAK